MIRYVSEKQVDLNRKTNSLKERVSQPKLQKARSTSEIPEDDENSSKALKKLKKINDYKEMLRGRLSVLQIQEEKNEFKAFLNEHRYQFHQQMMSDLERERDEKAEHLKRVHQKVMESHEKAKFERVSHHLNLKNAQDELKKSRGSDYEETKTRRMEIQKSLEQMKRQQSNFKRQRKLQIRNYENNQKANVQLYFKNKIQELKSTDGQQIEKISRVKQERAKQIDQLSKLQSIMLQKQARSKMSSLESEQRLKKLLNGSKTSSTQTTKLPSLSPEKRQQTDQDILLI